MADAFFTRNEIETGQGEKPSLASCLPETRKVVFSAFLIFGLSLVLIFYVDRPLALELRFIDPSLQKFFSYVTLLGKSTAYLVFFGTTFVLFYLASKFGWWRTHEQFLRKYTLITLFVFASIAVSGILTDVLKFIFARYRPIMLYTKGEYGFVFFKAFPYTVLSFPSGHANTIVAFMTALYFIKPRYGFIYLLTALMVMASRIIIGDHFLSDVIAGAYLGLVTTYYLKGLLVFWGNDIFDKKDTRVFPGRV